MKRLLFIVKFFTSDKGNELENFHNDVEVYELLRSRENSKHYPRIYRNDAKQQADCLMEQLVERFPKSLFKELYEIQL